MKVKSIMEVVSSNNLLAAAFIGILSVVGLQCYKSMTDSIGKNENQAYFKAKKTLTMKDMLLIKMLEENETRIDGKACWVITDPDLEDNPIIYCSDGFCSLTQYNKKEIENRNCRFLQGPDTDPNDVQIIRDAIKKKENCSACLLNYKKDGTTFINQFFLCPLYDDDGKLAYYVGVQAETNTMQENQQGKNIGWRIMNWL